MNESGLYRDAEVRRVVVVVVAASGGTLAVR